MGTKMSTRISTTILFLGIAVILAASSVTASATVKVTNITMQKLSQFTELTIVCDGPVTFEHQIVKATADKPYRIVVDVKGAVHALPQHNFSALPSGMIKRIRTSQFSTDPNIVRVVVDAANKLTYKVKEGTNSISLHIATPNDDNFTLWSAVPVSQTPELTQATMADKAAEPPTKMPAFQGNEENAPKVDYSDPAKKGLRLGSKPAVETKAETKSQPKDTKAKVAKTETKADAPENKEPMKVAQPTTVPEVPSPDLLTFVYGDSANEAAELAQEGLSSPAKAVKSAEPTEKAKQTIVDKANEKPAANASTPKSEKAATVKKSETRVNEQAANAQKEADDVGKVAEALANEPSKEPASEETRSMSDRVREKYRSNLDKNDSKNESGATDETDKAENSAVPKSKIEQIREKYKRGIKFAIDEQDERRQQYIDSQKSDGSDGSKQSVGPYNEFLPERQIVVYNSGGRVDPFAPLIEDAVAASQPQRLPDVEALRLVGVLLDDGDDRGLFQDFNGYYYILREGDSVKNGYLLSISETRATFQIRQYGWNRQVALDLDNNF